MENKTATIISNAFSEWVFVKVSSSNGEVLEQMVKPGESKKINTNYGQMKFQLSFIEKDDSRFGYKSTRVKTHNFHSINIGDHNTNYYYVIQKGEEGLELLRQDVGYYRMGKFFRT